VSQHTPFPLYWVEHVVRVEMTNSTMYYYEGEKGAVHLMRIEMTDGTVKYYEGEKGVEHVVRVEYPDGTVQGSGAIVECTGVLQRALW
jgi:hypothetical protein